MGELQGHSMWRQGPRPASCLGKETRFATPVAWSQPQFAKGLAMKASRSWLSLGLRWATSRRPSQPPPSTSRKTLRRALHVHWAVLCWSNSSLLLLIEWAQATHIYKMQALLRMRMLKIRMLEIGMLRIRMPKIGWPHQTKPTGATI